MHSVTKTEGENLRVFPATGQVARKSSRPKICRPKPELSRSKCGVISPEFYLVKCTSYFRMLFTYTRHPHYLRA